jgi:hypothetical protein
LRRLIRHAPDFRKDNGEAIRNVCREFVVLCRRIDLFSDASIAIDGSKFRAVNTRDRNFTQAKMQRRWSRSTKASTATSRRDCAELLQEVCGSYPHARASTK